MIRTTTNDIKKHGVSFKRDGYCYRITPENIKFWENYTNNCNAINVLKKKHGSDGFLFFHGMKPDDIKQLAADIESKLNFCEKHHLQVILVGELQVMEFE